MERSKQFLWLSEPSDNKHTCPTLRLPRDRESLLFPITPELVQGVSLHPQHLTIRILSSNEGSQRTSHRWPQSQPDSLSSGRVCVFKNVMPPLGGSIRDYSVLERACLYRQVTIPDQRHLRSLIIQVRASIAPTQKVLPFSLFPFLERNGRRSIIPASRLMYAAQGRQPLSIKFGNRSKDSTDKPDRRLPVGYGGPWRGPSCLIRGGLKETSKNRNKKGTEGKKFKKNIEKYQKWRNKYMSGPTVKPLVPLQEKHPKKKNGLTRNKLTVALPQ